MKHNMDSKLFIVFGLICGIFLSVTCDVDAAVYSRGNTTSTAKVTNKSSTFSSQLSKQEDDSESTSALANKINEQRAAIAAREIENNNKTQAKTGGKSNDCDGALRKCISDKCGSDYAKCATDTDTTFSDKLTACRKDTTCSAHEFSLFVNEIKEDKKQSVKLSGYDRVVSCGNNYNSCIVNECGDKFEKCLGKSAGDNALAKCKQIANDCTEYDSGMPGRIGRIFGIVRQDAEVKIKKDEKELTSLRDSMRKSCQGIGAMFDDRTFDCVFTVNFFAGDDQTRPKSSQKLFPGSLFDCTPDWFGIDITTFKENAYRATREQKSALMGMVGTGMGTLSGLLLSGEFDRQIDKFSAYNELRDACEKNEGHLKNGICVDNKGNKIEVKENSGDTGASAITPDPDITPDSVNSGNKTTIVEEGSKSGKKTDGDEGSDDGSLGEDTRAGKLAACRSSSSIDAECAKLFEEEYVTKTDKKFATEKQQLADIAKRKIVDDNFKTVFTEGDGRQFAPMWSECKYISRTLRCAYMYFVTFTNKNNKDFVALCTYDKAKYSNPSQQTELCQTSNYSYVTYNDWQEAYDDNVLHKEDGLFENIKSWFDEAEEEEEEAEEEE